MSEQIRYLSLDWIEAVGLRVAGDTELQKIGATVSVGITQVVTDGPEGTIIYHLQVGNNAVTFGAGPSDPEDVRLEQEWETAVDVATGAMTAEDAFISGSIRIGGDAQMLLQSQEVFAALDPIFVAVAALTDYH